MRISRRCFPDAGTAEAIPNLASYLLMAGRNYFVRYGDGLVHARVAAGIRPRLRVGDFRRTIGRTIRAIMGF
jgi:hypothetical protein